MSLNEFGRPVLSRRRKRRLRPLRRLLLLLLIFGLVYGVYSCSRFAYRAVFPELRLQEAVAAGEPLLAGQAVVLRDEVVVAAQRAGVLNQLRLHGSRIAAGELMFEIVDVNRLEAVDRQLAEEAERLAAHQAQSPEVITHLREQVAAAQADVRELSARYAYYLRTGDSTEAGRLFSSLQTAHRAAQAQREKYDFATRSQEQYAARRQELQNQRRQAILSVTSPLSGVLSYALDGREGELQTDDYRSLPLATVRQITGNPQALRNMAVVNAGQVIASVIDSRRAVLLMEADTVALGGEVEVLYQDTVLTASVLSNEGNASGSGLVALGLTDPPESLLTARVVHISVQPQGEILTRIPVSAVVTHETGDVVYVQSAGGEIEVRMVHVRQRRDGTAVVSGLAVNESVVTNPKALQAEGKPR